MRNAPLHSSLILVLLGLGCSPGIIKGELEPPKVVSISPSVLKARNDAIEVKLSKPVTSIRNLESCVRFGKKSAVSVAQLQKLSKAKGDVHVSGLVQVAASISDAGDLIRVLPQDALDFSETYALWVFDCLRDRSGLPLEFQEFVFQIEKGPLSIIGNDLPVEAEAKVPPNRKYFRFHFSHPIAKFETGAVTLNGNSVQTVLSEDHRWMWIVLHDPKSGCERIPSGSTVNIRFDGDIRDEEGRLLPKTEFKVMSDTDCIQKATVKKQFQTQPLAHDNVAQIEFETKDVAVVRLKYGLADADMDCLRHKCPTLWPLERGPKASILLEELVPERIYQYELDLEDVLGAHEIMTGLFETRHLANIAINEIMANPAMPQGQRETAGEFIELYNDDDQPVDVSGFVLMLDDKMCPLTKSDERILIGAKDFILIVGKKFEPQLFGLGADARIHRMSGQTICGNLRNWPLQKIVLKDDHGREVDGFLGMDKPKDDGYSIERLNEKFCYSRTDVGPTPLRVNGVTAKGCDK